MEQLVQVGKVREDGTAEVFLVRQSACSGDCHKCSGCGAVSQSVRFQAVNAIGAKSGEWVLVQSKSGQVLAAAAILYILPVVLFFLGYLLGSVLWNAGGLMGCLAFSGGILAAIVYDRWTASKQKTVYTITGYPGKLSPESQIKGDNDLD